MFASITNEKSVWRKVHFGIVDCTSWDLTSGVRPRLFEALRNAQDDRKDLVFSVL